LRRYQTNHVPSFATIARTRRKRRSNIVREAKKEQICRCAPCPREAASERVADKRQVRARRVRTVRRCAVEERV